MPKGYALLMKGRIELDVIKDGKIIARRRQGMHSFNANFLKWLAGLFSTPKSTTALTSSIAERYGHRITLPFSLTDTTGASLTILYSTEITLPFPITLATLGLAAPSGDATYGLVIGKGTTAPTPNDYKLESQYSEGTSVDQFSHGAVTVETPTISGNTITTRIIRTFTNNYTNAQMVSELGLIAWHRWQSSLGGLQDVKILIARDVLTYPVTVPASSSLTVRYIIEVVT